MDYGGGLFSYWKIRSLIGVWVNRSFRISRNFQPRNTACGVLCVLWRRFAFIWGAIRKLGLKYRWSPAIAIQHFFALFQIAHWPPVHHRKKSAKECWVATAGDRTWSFEWKWNEKKMEFEIESSSFHFDFRCSFFIVWFTKSSLILYPKVMCSSPLQDWSFINL